MKKVLIFFFSIFCGLYSIAQSLNTEVLDFHSYNKSYMMGEDFMISNSNQLLGLKISDYNPALLHIQNQSEQKENNDSILKGNTIIRLNYEKIKTEGVYSSFYGNDLDNKEISALWLYPLDRNSSFLGKASVGLGRDKGVLWNMTRYPSIFSPYVMMNEKGGDYEYQDYNFKGIYSKQLNDRFLLGAEVEYRGEYAHKDTDPRTKNMTSWLSAGMGVALSDKRSNVYSLFAKYTNNIQKTEADLWKGNIKERFLLMRGFGMFDNVMSENLYSKKRAYFVNNYQLGASSQIAVTSKTKLDFGFSYTYSHLKTEEQNTVNLFNLTTNKLEMNLFLESILSERLSFSTFFNAIYVAKKGKENIYSLVNVNPDNESIYDYNRIGVLENYTQQQNVLHNLSKLSYKLTKNKKLSFIAGAEYENSKEKYKGSQFITDYENIQSKLGIEFLTNFKKSVFNTTIFYTYKDNLYFENVLDQTYPNIFDPIYSQHLASQLLVKNSFSMDVNYLRSLQNGSKLGVDLAITYSKGKNKAFTVFDDKNSELWTNFSVYYLF